MALLNDYGVKIAKPGFDVATAGDIDLIFSSTWPSLTVAFETTVSGGTDVAHGLGFAPFTIAWAINGGISQMGAATEPAPNVDATNVYLSDPGSIWDTASQVHVKCFNIDLAEDVEYDVLTPPAVYDGSTSPDFGIKISKEGYDARDETDLRRFILHSRAQAPLVLAVRTQATSVFTDKVRYTSPLGYTSWVFGYVKSTGGLFRNTAYFSQAYPKLNVDDTNFIYEQQWLTAAGDDGATIVVLRDPMFAGTDVSASY